MLRLVHTSDWHLGHTLYDQPRTREHAHFLSFLLDLCAREQADALLIAGDIFDTSNPPAEAQAQWYGFLASLRGRLPHLQVVAIGGNHDSAGRLDAPAAILSALGVHMVGGLPRKASGAIDVDRLLVPLRDRQGQTQALVAAVPFLRPADLPVVAEESVDKLIEGVRRLYADVLAEAERRLTPQQALVAMGHLYMVGTTLSELSERKILGGHQHALPVELFGPRVAYAALGHLHRLQHVGGHKHLAYCGSPLPLSLREDLYLHAVFVADLDGAALKDVRPIPVPQLGSFIRIPDLRDDPQELGLPLDAILQELADLDPEPGPGPGPETGPDAPLRPLLELCVALDKPEPQLRKKLEQALTGKDARLVKLTARLTGSQKPLADAVSERSLRDLLPEDVFRAQYQRAHTTPVTDDLLKAFHELIDAAHHPAPRGTP